MSDQLTLFDLVAKYKMQLQQNEVKIIFVN